MSDSQALASWCTRIDVVVWKVSRGDHGMVTRLAELSDEAIGMAPGLTLDERATLLGRLQKAELVIRAAQEDVRTRLEELPARRRAARRYVAAPQPPRAR